MKQFSILVKKEWLHVFRDKKTLLLLFGMPIVQIVLFGFALTNEIKDSKIVILDNAKDLASKRIIDKIEESSSFTIGGFISNQHQIDEVFRENKAKMVLVIPQNFNQDLLREKNAKLQVVADGSDPNTANTLNSYVAGIVRNYQADISQNLQGQARVDAVVRMIYNPELNGTINFIPGVMALVIVLICVLMTSVSIVKEKEHGSMEVLLVSPFSPILVIFAKALPYFLLSLANLTVIIALSVFAMDMPMNGSLILLYLSSSLLIITALSLGLLISSVTSSQQEAMIMALMGMLTPTMLFTGFLFPIENMPLVLQWLSNIFPSKWYYIIVKSIMIKGLGFAAIWKELLVLAAMAFVLFYVSVRKFKIRLT